MLTGENPHLHLWVKNYTRTSTRWVSGRLKNAQWKIVDLELEWEEFLFRRGWKPTMVGIEACEMRNLFRKA
jgi:hypothetical protein